MLLRRHGGVPHPLCVSAEAETGRGAETAAAPPRRAARHRRETPDPTTHAGKTSYWDERYTKDPEPFDWYQRYSGIQELLQKYVKKDDAVLMAGCGNSRLSEDMFEDGYANLSNIDISRVARGPRLSLARRGTRRVFRSSTRCRRSTRTSPR